MAENALLVIALEKDCLTNGFQLKSVELIGEEK